VHRVGAQPVAVARFIIPFAKEAQGAAGRGFQAETAGQCSFVGLARKALEGGAGEQPFKAGRGELAEGELVSRFGPDQFGEKQGEMHIWLKGGGLASLPSARNLTGSNVQEIRLRPKIGSGRLRYFWKTGSALNNCKHWLHNAI
jgi:hypothetical protein